MNGCTNTDRLEVVTRAKDVDALATYDFDTLEECCVSKFGIKSCINYNVCTPSASPTASSTIPCQDRQWYYDSYAEKCTNDGHFNEDDNVFSYDSRQECCDDAFTLNCNYADVCNTEAGDP